MKEQVSTENNKEAARPSGVESVEYRPTTGVVVTLALLSALIIASAGFFFWYVPTVGLKHIHPALPYAFGAVVAVIVAFILFGGISIALSLSKDGNKELSPRYRGLLIKFFLPFMVLIGGLLKIPRIRIEKSFIEINNRMVRALALRGKGFNREKVLLLMPHCIQFDDCKIKVTRDVDNCVECGKCEIAGLLTLTRKHGLKMFVLTGGTVARRKLKEFRPDAVVAVACERDLTSGVQDAYPLPVIGIVNKRPHGYCLSTGVDIDEISRAIEAFLFPSRSVA